jgi:hypothetical protein
VVIDAAASKLGRLNTMRAILLSILLISSEWAMAGYHEGLQAVAKPGQIVVSYRGDCKPEKMDEAINLIHGIIAYERKNRPIICMSSPG